MMTEITTDLQDENPNENRDKLMKLLVGTAAGFIASRVAENGVEKILKWKRNR